MQEQGHEAAERIPKGEHTRRAVIEAAHELFLERGYHGTSMRDIAMASGLTVGGIYAHWADKESIWSAVLNAFHPLRRLIPVFHEIEAGSVETLFTSLAHRIVETLGTHRAALNLLFTELVEFKGSHFAAAFPELFPSFVEPLRVALSRGEMPLAYPPEILVRSFFGLIFSFFMTSLVLPVNVTTNNGSLDDFVNIYLHGITDAAASKDGPK